MAATQSKTGKAGSITIAGTVIPITSWSSKLAVDFADSTDSGNYDPGTGTLPKSQLPGAFQLEISIEAFWDAATTSSGVVAKAKAPGGGPYAVVLKLDASTTYCSGNFDLSDVDVKLTVPGASMVTLTCNGKSNGAFVLT
ncbi:hypothetical protein ACYOEI_29635 [Singulisphaera rosea]